MSGGTEWIRHSINDGSLVAVTDGSYIHKLYPNLCSAAKVLECSKGQGRIVGSFSERMDVANAYQGELLGLMVIHLILLSVNKINPMMKGRVEVLRMKLYKEKLGVHRKKKKYIQGVLLILTIFKLL